MLCQLITPMVQMGPIEPETGNKLGRQLQSQLHFLDSLYPNTFQCKVLFAVVSDNAEALTEALLLTVVVMTSPLPLCPPPASSPDQGSLQRGDFRELKTSFLPAWINLASKGEG